MFVLGEEDPWLCSFGTDINADFCIWVLEEDGLHVPPFVHHSGGTGILRAAELNEENWLSWVQEVVRRKDQHTYTFQKQSVQVANDTYRDFLAKGGVSTDPQSEDARQYLQAHQQEFTQLFMQIQQRSIQAVNDVYRDFLAKRGVSTDLQSEEAHQYLQAHEQEFTQFLIQAQQAYPHLLFPERSTPPDIWDGSSEVGERLTELWRRYEPISNQRFAWEKKLRIDRRNSDNTTNIWQDLAPYHTRLDSFIVHYVAYSHEITYPVPPRSVIMTVVNGQLDDVNLRTRSLQAAEALAASLSS